MLTIIPINNQTWLICGGRNFADQDMFKSAMSDLVQLKGMPVRIIHGGAKGADSMATGWATLHALELEVEKAKWAEHGKAAGPIRNQTMLEKYSPHLVIAFPGGKGTADMVNRARDSGVDVAEIKI